MADIAQSILNRLKMKARSSGKNYQLLLQLFCQEEFLRRLECSDYKQNLILKGGLLLYCISGFQGRPTQDIDFLLKNLSNTEDSILSRFSEDPEMLTKWRHFTKTTLKASVDFNEVIHVIVTFVAPAFDAIIHESEFLKEWKPESLSYEPYK